MEDKSALDNKYFVDHISYNCPFCNRNHVVYVNRKDFKFDWGNDKECFAYLIECTSCKKVSLHLSFENIIYPNQIFSVVTYPNFPRFQQDIEIDSKIFYSQPTSFFVIDKRIPAIIRELITEAEGSLKMNYLTGASACIRKAIYELLIIEKAEGEHYEERIKFLKSKYPDSDPKLFDILAQIQDMTSDKIHEQSWDKWDSPNLKLISETLKTVLFDIYVLPEIKKERSLQIERLQESLKKDKKLNESP
ncbi:hypothetical protein ACFLVZ_01465 [Chloroflexota bacterium]